MVVEREKLICLFVYQLSPEEEELSARVIIYSRSHKVQTKIKIIETMTQHTHTREYSNRL